MLERAPKTPSERRVSEKKSSPVVRIWSVGSGDDFGESPLYRELLIVTIVSTCRLLPILEFSWRRASNAGRLSLPLAPEMP